MGIRVKIQLIFGITILMMIGMVGCVASLSSYSTMVDEVKRSMVSSAKLASDNIANQLYNYMEIVESVGRNSIISGENETLDKIAVLEEYVLRFGVTSGNLLDLNGVSLKDGTDFSEREYVQRALAGEVNVSEVTQSKYTGNYGVSIAAPVIDALDRVVGVVYFRVDNDFMTSIIETIRVTDNSYAYIVDEKGNVVAHINTESVGTVNIQEETELVKSGVSEEILKNTSGSYFYTYQDQKLFCGFAVVENTNGWKLVIASPQSDMLIELWVLIRRIVALAIAAVIISILVSAIIANGISRSINRVKNVLISLSQGELSCEIEESSKKDEIAQLQNSTRSLLLTLSGIIGQANNTLSQMSEYNLQRQWMGDYPGSFNSLAQSINKINEIFGDILLSMKQCSVDVADGAKQIADATGTLSQGASQQAISIKEIVTDVTSMTNNIANSSKSGNIVSQRLENLDREIHISNSEMLELKNSVEVIESMSSDIKKKIGRASCRERVLSLL